MLRFFSVVTCRWQIPACDYRSVATWATEATRRLLRPDCLTPRPESFPFVAKEGALGLNTSFGWTSVLAVSKIGLLRRSRTIPKGVPWLRSRSVSTDKGLGSPQRRKRTLSFEPVLVRQDDEIRHLSIRRAHDAPANGTHVPTFIFPHFFCNLMGHYAAGARRPVAIEIDRLVVGHDIIA